VRRAKASRWQIFEQIRTGLFRHRACGIAEVKVDQATQAAAEDAASAAAAQLPTAIQGLRSATQDLPISRTDRAERHRLHTRCLE
jgi:hypothetical protein